MKDSEDFSLPIYNTAGKQIDVFKLEPAIFAGKINTAAIYQAVNQYRAGQRKGLASTKTRGEVSGGGKKPWRQKGTGRARVGSIRSPLWRHGGVVFGPHPRDFACLLPAKVKALALKSALALKAKNNNLIILDKFTLEHPKTKEAVKVFSNLKLIPDKSGRPRTLLLLDKTSTALKQALGNISFLEFNLAKDTQAYQVMAHKKLLITRDAILELTKRLKK